jgi:hypothetical protein
MIEKLNIKRCSKMSKSFIAINLDEFHSNQLDGSTKAQIQFVLAENIDKAKDFMHRYYPNIAWAVIPKNQIDKNIVYKE